MSNQYEACPYCKEEVSHVAPDGLSVCNECDMIVEGSTIQLTREEIPSDLDARLFIRED